MSAIEFKADPGKHDTFVTKIYDAPPSLLYKAHTDPEAIPQWWGPSFLTTTVERLEAHKGGIWRFVQQDPQGNQYAFNGVFHECLAPHRLISTWEFEGMPGHVLLQTITFEELPDGKTKMTEHSVFQTVEDRDGMLQSGAEAGAEMYDRLANLLERMKA